MNRTPPSLLVESSEESARKAAVNLLQTRAGKPGYEGMVMAPIQKRLDAVTKAFAEGSEGLEQILSHTGPASRYAPSYLKQAAAAMKSLQYEVDKLAARVIDLANLPS